MVLICFMSSNLTICLKTSAVKAGPLSEIMIFGKLKTKQTSSTIVLAAVRAVQSKVGPTWCHNHIFR